MRIRTNITRTYTLFEAECTGFIEFYINETDWQNTIELSSERFLGTIFKQGEAVISLTDLTDDNNPIRYKISGHLSYTRDKTPIKVSIPSSKGSKGRKKELEKMVEDSIRFLVEIEQRTEEER